MQIIFTWFFSFWLSSGSSLLTSNPKVAWATLLLLTSKFSSSDLQIFLLLTSKFWKKKLLQFFTSPNTCYPHTLCQLSSQTCFCTLLLNNILHITFSAFHWSWIYLWMKTQQKSLKKIPLWLLTCCGAWCVCPHRPLWRHWCYPEGWTSAPRRPPAAAAAEMVVAAFNLHVHVQRCTPRNVRTTLPPSADPDLAGPCLRGSPVLNCFLISTTCQRDCSEGSTVKLSENKLQKMEDTLFNQMLKMITKISKFSDWGYVFDTTYCWTIKSQHIFGLFNNNIFFNF